LHQNVEMKNDVCELYRSLNQTLSVVDLSFIQATAFVM